MKRIESPKNERVKEIKKLHTKKGRDKSKEFFIEGEHIIEEALKSSIMIKEIFIREEYVPKQEWDLSNIPLTYVTDRVMKEMSDTETPQGIAAICEVLYYDLDVSKGTYLLIDGVQDPGNVGTMIRTADAAGITAVILGQGTVDMYNSKVIRATQGSLFHIPVVRMDLESWVDENKEIPVFGTALENASTYSSIEPQEHFALIVGNEGEGVSSSLLNQTDQNLYVPIYGQAESLNVAVATGILLYHLKAR